MVDDQPDAPSVAPGGNRPKRTPPTIDLEATEVSHAPAASATGAGGAGDPPPPPQDDPPADAPSNPGPGPAAAESGLAEAPPARPATWATASIAALVGALAACGVIGAAVLAGWPSAPATVAAPPPPDSARLDALANRIAAIESRPAAAAPDAALAARLGSLERELAETRRTLEAERARSEQLTSTVEALKTAPREAVVAAPAPDLSPLTDRLGRLEGALRTLSLEAAQQRAAPPDDKPLRRLIALSMLDQQVQQGAPYAPALAAARPLVSSPEMLKPLERFADAGVPSAGALGRQLLTVIGNVVPAPAKPDTNAGVLDRLQAGAERLVRIHRVDAAAEAGRSPAIRRAAAAARRDDIAAARQELAALPDAERAPFQGWLADAEAREAALAASRRLAADAIAALNKPTP